MAILQAHGCDIEYEWVGERVAGRPTLVFVHQGLGSVGLWRDFPARLAAATGCPAFLYSREGYGGSSTCAWPRPRDFMQIEGRDRLPEVLAAAGIDDFILLGHSDGGTIALVYAAEVRTGLRGLIVEAFHVFVEAVTLDGIRRARESYEQGDLREKLERHHGTNVDSAFYGWAASWLQPGMDAFSIADMLPRIEAPVLGILGTRDDYGTTAQLDSLAEGVRAPLELASPDCGHSPHEELEAEMLALMAGFVARLQEPAQSP